MKFKTNARCQGCVAAIRQALAAIVPADKVNFNLASPDRVMTIDADVNADAVIAAVKGAGFDCSLL